MADMQIELSAEERDCLVQVLEAAVKNHRVEEHRTRTPTYPSRRLLLAWLESKPADLLGGCPPCRRCG